MADLIQKYAKANAKDRVGLIYKHFPTFLGIIESRVDGLVYLIENEKETARREELGDLGVRVQQSNISDVTGNTATSYAMIRKAIVECDFRFGVLDGTEREEEFKAEAFILKRMRKDYQLFNNQLNSLDPESREMLVTYMKSHKDAPELADSKGIANDSVRKQAYRIKEQIKDQMIKYMEGRM